MEGDEEESSTPQSSVASSWGGGGQQEDRETGRGEQSPISGENKGSRPGRSGMQTRVGGGSGAQECVA